MRPQVQWTTTMLPKGLEISTGPAWCFTCSKGVIKNMIAVHAKPVRYLGLCEGCYGQESGT